MSEVNSTTEEVPAATSVPLLAPANGIPPGNQVYYGNNMTASLIVSIPTLLVYLFLGRYFLRGLLSGSLKG